MKEFIDRYDPKITRWLEIASGSFSFLIISFPLWGSIKFPELAAYLIILFDVYWLYKSGTLALNAVKGYIAIKRTVAVDWWSKTKKLSGYKSLRHIVFIPSVNEPEEILRRTLTFLADQEFDSKKISIVLATEAKVPAQHAVCQKLAKEFSSKFEKIWLTQHTLVPGEIVGKSSNLAFAGREIKKEVDRLGWDKNWLTVTSCDADVGFHTKYFGRVSYMFLSNPERHLRFWQGAMLYYNNIWRVPMPVRIINTLYSINGIAIQFRPMSQFNYSSYTLSWKLLEESDFWDVDVIPEDWHLFFKAFFSHKGNVEVEFPYIPLYADAAEGPGYWGSVKSNYIQVRRWAWGITDLAYALKTYLRNTETIPFGRFMFKFSAAVENHIFWPANWFLLVLGATIPVLVNPAFKETALGFSLPSMAGLILTFAAVGLLSIIIIDIFMRPPRPESFKKWHMPMLVIQYLFMPITTFFFSALPGMDAHMRLILGKRLEYKVTEKIA